MLNPLNLDDLQFMISENEKLNEKNWCPGCHQLLTDDTQCGSQRCPEPVSAAEYAPVALTKIAELEAEVARLKEKCDKQAMILRRLSPDKFPNTLFITGILGALDSNNMPKKICVVPAYGVDFSYVYEYNGTNIVTEW